MTRQLLSRRRVLTVAGLAAGAVAANTSAFAASEPPKAPFLHCLNMATIRAHKLSIVEEIEVAAKAGYTAVEIWLERLNSYVQQGGSLPDLKKRIADLGLTVEGAIAFANWIVDDDQQRAKGLEQARRDMESLAKVGCKRIAAPPAGATDKPGLDLLKAAERYRAMLEIGEQVSVTPALELWGSSANLHRLGEVAYVAVESGHPSACIVADVFHIYKGGSDFAGIALLASAMPIFHINDYPADPPRDKIRDANRVYPGDGIAPLTQILRDLKSKNGVTVLSLELFNPELAKLDPVAVAKTGLEKTREAVRKADVS